MFHWADSNLKELWKNHPEVDTGSGNCRWLIKQCVGIATSLRRIHRVADSFHGEEQSNSLNVPSSHNQGGDKSWGRHGDIKPENILWFKQRNLLVISDFGLSRFHTKHSKSADPYDSLFGISATYRAPECDLRLNINQKYDIWALGCVFLEFISWFVLDNTIDDFVTARVHDDERGNIQEDKFFTIINDEAKVKDSVLMVSHPFPFSLNIGSSNLHHHKRQLSTYSARSNATRFIVGLC
jgi:serine/threonine protein kinase